MEPRNRALAAVDWFFNWKPRTPDNVLVVEDDEMLKPLIAQILYRINSTLNLTWTTNMEDARDLLDKEKYDLVITDFTLEGAGTGIDLQHYCLEKHPATPVVLISSTSKETFKARGLVIDDIDFLQKPIVPLKFVGAIQGILKQRCQAKIRSLFL